MAKTPKTQSQKLGENLIIAAMLGVLLVALFVTANHDKATAIEPQQSTETTQLEMMGSLPPIAVVGNDATPVTHAPRLQQKSVATTAKPKAPAAAKPVESPVVVVWGFPTCTNPNRDKVAAIEKMSGPFTEAQVKGYVC